MAYNEAANIISTYLLSKITDCYGLEGFQFELISAHTGGRNITYECTKDGERSKILRIVYLTDRNKEDLLAEVEFIRYLASHGANVADVIDTKTGALLIELQHDKHTFYVSLFEKAIGNHMWDNNYRYREGVSITEYFYNCGKVLGKIHQLSKQYQPTHVRYGFFDKYKKDFIDKMLPDELGDLKAKLVQLVEELKELPKDSDSFGLIHFDFNENNYMVDFLTGNITVYDFDNSCYCWYVYDLAELWVHGVGWIQFEPDANKRRSYMNDYFNKVLEGYRSETSISGEMLEKLPLFIQTTLLESVIDEFESSKNNGEEPELDEDFAYRTKCLLEDIPYYGFFDEIYSVEAPFEYEE